MDKLPAFFSGGVCGGPVSSSLSGECNAITNRWFGECDLTFVGNRKDYCEEPNIDCLVGNGSAQFLGMG
jgi:hypothetical protein